ncbi:DNA replication and repair protein RadC [Neolewinella xylanilytica]|uniref:DNA replication and repair protein RadC n=1 Tax=Neolewinella xylanilytica TaxID=1514080 RepID=A0A2S6I2X3_9BACT|nr:DNA repair protein RadC [Neolewinella xylanilytica]PPK85528.1 DNA replication and repair protein RadC [Neolewinella xylanilytica]
MITSVSSSSLICDLAPDEQPREKLLARGPRTLSDAELVAILLRSGRRGVSAVDLARCLLRSADHDLHRLARMQLQDLVRTKGIGAVKGAQLLAAFELGRRRAGAMHKPRTVLDNSEACFHYLQPVLADLPHEEFHVLCLNRANQVLGAHLVSSGGTTGTVADAKKIFRTALQHGSVTSLVLAHNHPSGQAHPSSADIRLTSKLCRAAHSLDLHVLDHIIVAGHRYYSFADHQLLGGEE